MGRELEEQAVGGGGVDSKGGYKEGVRVEGEGELER